MGDEEYDPRFRSTNAAVSDDTRAYFSRIALLLKDADDSDDTHFMLRNVFKEMRGEELNLMMDKKLSKALESILRRSSALQLRSFLYRLQLLLGKDADRYAALCCNPYASFVLQALFDALAVAPAHGGGQSSMGGGEENEDEEDAGLEDNVIVPEEKRLVGGFLRSLGDDLLEMTLNVNATHVFRSLVLYLSGTAFQSKAARRRFDLEAVQMVAHQQEEGAAGAEQHAKWKLKLLRKVCKTLLYNASKDAQLVVDTLLDSNASPSLQLALVALARLRDSGRSDSETYDAMCSKLMCTLLKMTFSSKKGKVKWSKEAEAHVLQLLCDTVGSHMLQVVVRHSNMAVFKALYKHCVSENARRLSLDPCSNYVVVDVLQRVARERWRKAYNELFKGISGAGLDAHFRGNRMGVLQNLAHGAAVVGTPEVQKKLVHRMQGDAASLWPRLLGSVADVERLGAGVGRQSVETVKCLFHFDGSVWTESGMLLPFWKELREQQVARMAQNRVWSEVLEAFIGCDALPWEAKQKLTKSLRRHAVEISNDKYGNHVMTTLLSHCPRGAEKEKLVEKLSANYHKIAVTHHGKRVTQMLPRDITTRRKRKR